MSDHNPDAAGEPIIRRQVEINGENYYLAVGLPLVQATVPFENRQDRQNERLVVETICRAISESLALLLERNHGNP